MPTVSFGVLCSGQQPQLLPVQFLFEAALRAGRFVGKKRYRPLNAIGVCKPRIVFLRLPNNGLAVSQFYFAFAFEN